MDSHSLQLETRAVEEKKTWIMDRKKDIKQSIIDENKNFFFQKVQFVQLTLGTCELDCMFCHNVFFKVYSLVDHV